MKTREIPGTAKPAPANRPEVWSTVKRVTGTRQHLRERERERERVRKRETLSVHCRRGSRLCDCASFSAVATTEAV